VQRARARGKSDTPKVDTLRGSAWFRSTQAGAEPEPAKRVALCTRDWCEEYVPTMPEGPSIVILREEAAGFTGKKIVAVSGNTKIDKSRLVGQRIVALRSWGKHFLIEFDDFSVRIHFLLFGSYRINEGKQTPPRLSLKFARGEFNFYACSVQFIEGQLDDTYDWRTDVMSDRWDPALALKKLRAMPDALACDAILDQTVFAGVGNIMKNEVLFRIHVHPLSTLGAMPAKKLREMVEQARVYSFEFLAWKKAYVLKKHWLVHTRGICPRCEIPLGKGKLGRTQRRSFFCENCQKKYVEAPPKRTRSPSVPSSPQRRKSVTALRTSAPSARSSRPRRHFDS
jgi:endonuclease-8